MHAIIAIIFISIFSFTFKNKIKNLFSIKIYEKIRIYQKFIFSQLKL